MSKEFRSKGASSKKLLDSVEIVSSAIFFLRSLGVKEYLLKKLLDSVEIVLGECDLFYV